MHVACAHIFSNLQNHQCVSQVNTNNEDRHTVRITYYIQLPRKKYSVPLLSPVALVLELQVWVEAPPFLQRSPQHGRLRRHTAVFGSPL